MSDVPLITGTSSLDLLTEAGLSATAPITSSNRPFFWQQLERIRAALAICDTVGAIKHARVTLTDAQIKALPTTAVTLVSAPGGSELIVPIMLCLKMNPAAGAYTNINNGGTPGQSLWDLQIGSTEFGNSLIFNDVGESNTGLSDFIGTTAPTFLVTTTCFFSNESSFNGIFSYSNSTPAFVGQALKLRATNTTNGNYTGGNAANTLIVDVIYMVL